MTLNNPDADFEVDAEAMSFIVETGCARAVVEDEDIDEMHVSNCGYGANVKLMIEATGDAVDIAGATLQLDPATARRLAAGLQTATGSTSLEQYSPKRSRGCTRFDISQRCSAHWFDDEDDLVVIDNYSDHDSGQAQTLTPEQAESLRDDLTAALAAVDEEQERDE